MEDKFEDQARSFQQLDDYEATPLQGAGRWAEIPGGTLYTNDANILFLQGDDTPAASSVYQALDKAFKSGQTASAAFNRLAAGSKITGGDLSELG